MSETLFDLELEEDMGYSSDDSSSSEDATGGNGPDREIPNSDLIQYRFVKNIQKKELA